ncbi:hypothetical protein QWI30_30865 [Citrobacter freundii]|nr:hypothetical protein [Citrobacter freundii]
MFMRGDTWLQAFYVIRYRHQSEHRRSTAAFPHSTEQVAVNRYVAVQRDSQGCDCRSTFSRSCKLARCFNGDVMSCGDLYERRAIIGSQLRGRWY